MKIVKYLLLAVAAVGVLIGGAVAYIAATFNPNSYKPQIIQLVKDKKQRTLKLDGDIKLKFWPSIGADLGKLALSEFNSEAEFAAVENARVSLKVMPMLSKKFVVDELEITGVRAAIVKFKDGRMNIDDLLSKDEQKQDQVEFDVAHVKVQNATLTYRDDAQRASYTLSKVNLSTGRIAPNVPGKIDLSATLQGDKPKMNLAIALKTRLTFDLENQLFALDGMGLEAKGQAAEISNLNAKAAGSITARLKAGELTTNGLSLAFTAVSGKDNLDLKFDAPKLVITKDKASGDKVTVVAKITQPQGETLATLVMPGIEGTAQAFKSAGMTLDLEVKRGDQNIKARMTSPLSGNFQTQQISLPQLGVNITASGPNLPGKSLSGNLTGNASVNGAKQQVQANLSGKVADSTIKAQLGVNGFTPPGLNFDIEIDQLDLDKYAPQQGTPAAAGGAGADKLIDLTALRALNASGKLRIGTLKASNVKASNVRLEIKAAGGQMTVSPLSANLYQGAMDGAVTVNAVQASPSFAIRQKLSGVAIGPLLKDLASKDLLEGKGTLNVDVRTSGATAGALKRALNGSAALNLRDGAVKGIDIARTINDAKAKLGSLRGQQTQAADNTKKTEFSELSATFAINNGVAHNNDLLLKSPLLRVGGEGDINIGADSVNYLVKAAVVGTLTGQDGRGVNELTGVTVPVRRPALRPEPLPRVLRRRRRRSKMRSRMCLKRSLGVERMTPRSPATRLIAWHKRHGRHDLPWQRSRDAYAIWLSEIMLQQTQVGTVIPYYERFLKQFPTVQALAQAPLDAVLTLWSGLGYYSRAHNLHRAAGMVVDCYGGTLPADPALLQALPGIGRSTAAAICVFSYDGRHAILDGNVKRVLARYRGVRGYPGDAKVQEKLWRKAEALLPARRGIASYTQGLMDLGASLCARRDPQCARCPLRVDCVAHLRGLTGRLPDRKPSRVLPQRETMMLVLRDAGEILLEKRTAKGIWGGLWSLPEVSHTSEVAVALKRYGVRVLATTALPLLAHGFTHFKLAIEPLLLEVKKSKRNAPVAPGVMWLPAAAAVSAAIPAPVRKIIVSHCFKPRAQA